MGISKQLFQNAILSSKERGCSELKVGTQNNNVNACKFYSKMGCELKSINKRVYLELKETHLIFVKKL